MIVDEILTGMGVPKKLHTLGKPVEFQKQVSIVSMGKLFHNGLVLVHENESYRKLNLSYIVALIQLMTCINISIVMKNGIVWCQIFFEFMQVERKCCR